MNVSFVGFLLLMSGVGLAQTTTDPTADLRLSNLNNIASGPLVFKTDTRYEGQHGTPYLLPDWTQGQVSLTNGKQYASVPLKFDAHRQELIMLRPRSGNDSIIVDKQTVNRFLLVGADGQSYLFSRYPALKTNDDAVRNGYFLILYEGKSTLMKRVAKTVKAADYKGGYSSDVRYDAYQDAISYYILKADQTLTKVKLTKKALLDALNDRQEALNSFVAQEKLSFKTEQDALLLVKEYDRLRQ